MCVSEISLNDDRNVVIKLAATLKYRTKTIFIELYVITCS